MYFYLQDSTSSKSVSHSRQSESKHLLEIRHPWTAVREGKLCKPTIVFAIYSRFRPSMQTPTDFPLPLNVLADQVKFLVESTPRHHAGLPVPNGTQSFWLRNPDVTPLPDEGSTGALTPDADICIIGSGISGVSAAYHLARLLADRSQDAPETPLKVVILEAREFCMSSFQLIYGHDLHNFMLKLRRYRYVFSSRSA